MKLCERRSRRRQTEDRLALLFATIVAVFLVCFASRIVLGVYESIELDSVVACSRSHLNALPPWVWLMTSVSNVMVAINSAVNMPIYCLWNGQFRKVAIEYLGRCLRGQKKAKGKLATLRMLALNNNQAANTKQVGKVSNDKMQMQRTAICLCATHLRLTPTGVSGLPAITEACSGVEVRNAASTR